MSIAEAIFPGNWVCPLSSYQNQPVIALPGRVYYQRVGYIKVTTAATSWDVIIPSPDKRQDDKPRPDITGLVVPQNAYLYSVGLRVLDARKDRGVGTARSGLVFSVATERIKLASAVTVGNATNTSLITATTASTPPLVGTGGTVAPSSAQGSVYSEITPVKVTQSNGLTLKLFLDNGTAAGPGAAAGTLSSSEVDGSYLIADVCYYLEDGVADESYIGGLPFPSGV